MTQNPKRRVRYYHNCHTNTPCSGTENKFCFHQKKESTLCSLCEVEHFLCNFRKAWRSVELFKLLRF